MIKVKAYPTIVLGFMGSMDCLTTVIGILYFGAVEYNPLLSGIINTNIGAFVALKLMTTVFVCLTFFQAEKSLMKSENKDSKSFRRARMLLRIAGAGTIVFLVIVVTNNLIVLFNAV
jgi:hypothetical protein